MASLSTEETAKQFRITLKTSPHMLLNFVTSHNFDPSKCKTTDGTSIFFHLLDNMAAKYMGSDACDEDDDDCCVRGGGVNFIGDVKLSVSVIRALRAKCSSVPDDAIHALDFWWENYEDIYMDFDGTTVSRKKALRAYNYIKFLLGKDWMNTEMAPPSP